MAGNNLRSQYPYAGDALSPRPTYDYPSPTSNYPSGIGAPSPAFSTVGYQSAPRFGGSAFIPPPDVFLDGRKGSVQEVGYGTPPTLRARRSNAFNSDPVAMHLLVETAMGDSQNFEILSVEEVETMKQEQKIMDGRLKTVKKRLESETKIRDAARSLTRLTSKQDKGRRRGLSSRGSNLAKDTSSRSEEELKASNKKVDDLGRELMEIESRMRLVDMQLLMHTAAVLQLTHNGPSKRSQGPQITNTGGQRPDSPASIYTYEGQRSLRPNGEDDFDERSLYRSPENLDNLMNALQNGTHQRNESTGQQPQAIAATAKRLEELSDRLRGLIVQANPERNRGYSRAPQAGAIPDSSSIEQLLDFLDQGLRDVDAEQTTHKKTTESSLNAMEGRLEGINNQLYAMLSRSNDNTAPPPSTSRGDPQDQLNYMEDSFYNVEQLQYSTSEQINELRAKSAALTEELEQIRAAKSSGDKGSQQYEATLMGLWEIIRAGEDEARQRKQERRQLLAQDPGANEDISPDEDYNPNEEFSLGAFSAKVQMLYSRASTLKDKQCILVRQIKQQRELNSRSDAQKEEQFEQLKEEIMSARSAKASMEKELERAMSQLKEFDESKAEAESVALQNLQAREASDSKALRNAEERIAASAKALEEAQERIAADSRALQDAKARIDADSRTLQDAQKRIDAESKAVRGAQERIEALETQLKEAQDDARVEAATIQAERSQSTSKADEALAKLRVMSAEKETMEAELAQMSKKIDETLGLLKAASSEKDAAEARSLEATKNLTTREDELRNLESEVVRLTTELTFAKAELDGAYGTRAERAAESASNPTIKKELDVLAAKNESLLIEIEGLRKTADVASLSEAEARDTERNLKQELTGMAADYEALTRDAIQNEKDRDSLEASIDKLRDEKDALEMELSEERVKWLGIRSPSVPNGGGAATMEATSIRMLREDFRKMMRDRTAEGLRALRNEQEERRKLEALVRSMRKDATPQRSNLSKTQPVNAS